MGGGGIKKNYNSNIKNKILHMNSELKKINTKWRSGKRAKRKILMKR